MTLSYELHRDAAPDPTAARFGKKRRVDGGYMAKGITDDEIDDVSTVEEKKNS